MSAEQGQNRPSESTGICQNQVERVQGVSWSGQQDSNLRPVVPKTTALPGCAIPRYLRLWIHGSQVTIKPSKTASKPGI